MLANYEEHGFKITAKVMPDTCTSCPFWCLNLENCEKGICSITGTEIIADGPQDTKRMDDCPLEKENKNMKEELQKLFEKYGIDTVVKAAAEATTQHIPTINTPVVTDEQLITAGIPAGLIRISCGLEDKNDLIADIAQALDAI